MRPRRYVQPDGTKQCHSCNIFKNAELDFTWTGAGNKSPEALCKECKNIKNSNYRKTDPEKARATDKKRRQNCKESIARAQNRYAIKIGLRNKRKYHESDQGRRKSMEYSHNRNALKKGAWTETSHLVTGAWFASKKKEQNFRCYYCFSMPMDFEMDHVAPISRGGKHVCENIVASCIRCNRSKNNKLLSEWPQPQLAIAIYGLDLASA